MQFQQRNIIIDGRPVISYRSISENDVWTWADDITRYVFTNAEMAHLSYLKYHVEVDDGGDLVFIDTETGGRGRQPYARTWFS